jgi:hypothetical protein
MMDGRYAGEKTSLSGNDETLVHQLYSGANQPPADDGAGSDGSFLATGSGGFHIVSIGAGSNTGNLDFGSLFSLQNPKQPLDTNDDQSIDPLDVLTVINWINSHEASTPIDSSIAAENYYDVDGDNTITPLDVLVLINFINSRLGAMGEGEAPNRSLFESLNSVEHFPVGIENAFQTAFLAVETNNPNSDRSVNNPISKASLGLLQSKTNVVLDTIFSQSADEGWGFSWNNESEHENSDDVEFEFLLKQLAFKRHLLLAMGPKMC